MKIGVPAGEPLLGRTGEVLFLALVLSGAACASVPPGPEKASDVTLPICRPVEGLEPLLVPGAVLLLGEMHGTVESPAFVADSACLALRAGRRVTVALEIPREEQERVEAYLASAGTDTDRTALLDAPFWNSPYQDGRRSRAMLSLLDDLRRFSHEGLPVSVLLIDRSVTSPVPRERDHWMGEALALSTDATPKGLLIALTGNLHSRVTRGSPWDPGYEPAGFVLVSLRPGLKVTSLNVSYQGGTAWFCTSDDPSSCQVRAVDGSASVGSRRVVLYPEVKNGYSGVYEVGRLTASPPAHSPSPSEKDPLVLK